jgi:uncharacterized protein YegP (UPF0339 family)
MAGKFEVFVDKSKQYRFRLKATNGEIIASSEGYETKVACLKGIASVQKNAPTAKIVDPEEDAVKKPAAKKPAAKKPAVKKPAARKPAAEK